MTGISIELIDHLGDDLTVANAARVSFGKWKTEFDERDAKLINYLASHEHMSPFRHPQIQLRCKAPIFIARQLQKHTIGLSWNEVSRRYVDTDVEFFVPDSWRSRPDDGIKQGSGCDIADQDYLMFEYEDFIKRAEAVYEYFLDKGVAPEMARMVLPQSMLTEWIWTGSLQAFFHVYRLRIDYHAQKEAQEFAKQLGHILEDLFPHSMDALKNA